MLTNHQIYDEHSNCMDIQNLSAAEAFITKDGSEIRELLAHRNSCIAKQSLAEARVPVGAITQPHYHPKTEEIYYILSGEGRMTIDQEQRKWVSETRLPFPHKPFTASKTPERSC